MPPLAAHGGFEFKTYAIRRGDGRYEAYFAIRAPGASGWLRQIKVALDGGFACNRSALIAADWEARAWIDDRQPPA